MDLDQVIKSYKEVISKEQDKHKALNKTIFQIGTLRLVVVLISIGIIYFMWGNTTTIIIAILICAVLFGMLLKYHNRLFERRLYSEIQIRNAQNELQALDYNFTAFDGAPEKMDAEHSYSLDLDLFGNRSFFQSFNRTVTSFGKDALADAILYPIDFKEKIELQQKAIIELSKKPKLLAHFRTIGQMSEIDSLNTKDYDAVFNRAHSFYQSKLWKAMLYIVPASYILLSIPYFSGLIDGNYFIYLWILMMAVSSIPIKKVSIILNIFDKKTATLNTYSKLFSIIENEVFKSEILCEIQSEVKNSISASKAIGQLKSHHDNLSLSTTFPILFLFNPILLWNVRYASKIEQWIETHKSDIQKWFDAIGRFDAIVSLATFAYNHPDYTYPEITEDFKFEASELGHPLIDRNRCVKNNVKITHESYFLVVTGANMAGKSTYLRTIGINQILAGAGLPVFAKSFKFYPCKLITNLRTSDSLADNESYFFAELKRLKIIIDRLQTGEKLFIILDEILKGTNSEDKQKGSLALMRQLLSLGAKGVIATHDLVLGTLEKEYPDNVKNYCFEADIKEDNLSFTYKIREGVAQNMNACFLMKKMGITGL